MATGDPHTQTKQQQKMERQFKNLTAENSLGTLYTHPDKDALGL